MDIELRHLYYFVAVAEELNFGRAAERLHIAQPPLTRQIRQLEQALGVRLFHRTTRRIELTEAGQIYLTQDDKPPAVPGAYHLELLVGGVSNYVIHHACCSVLTVQ